MTRPLGLRGSLLVLVLLLRFPTPALSGDPSAENGFLAGQSVEVVERVDAADVLARVRGATGWPERLGKKDILLRGHAKARGLEGSFHMRFDTAGRFVLEFDGPFRVAKGHDGEVAWSLDPSGVTRVLEGGEREATLGDLWVCTGYWLSSDAPFTVEPAGDSGEGSSVDLRLSLDGGIYQGTISIDRATWFPHRFRLFEGQAGSESAASESEFILDGYASEQGFFSPRRIVLTRNGETEFEITLTSARLVERDVEAYKYREEEILSSRFDARVDSDLITRRGPTGHHYVRAELGGKDFGWCLFDTGSTGTILSKKSARRLDLEVLGRGISSGVGGRVPGQFHRLPELRLGPVTVYDVPVKSMRLSELSDRMGVRLAAILGNDVLGRCVIEYDQRNSRIGIFDPDSYRLARGEWRELTIYGGKPAVVIEYEGNQGTFTIDTAAPSGILIGRGTIARQGLLANRETRPGIVQGLGGAVEAELGSLEWVDFGGVRFEDVPAKFITEEKGTSSDRFRDGILGTYMLESFVIVFDMPNGRIAYLPHDETAPVPR